MTRDIHTLLLWARIVASIAAMSTTIVPIIYSTFPWQKSRIGRLFMWQAMSFALAMNLTLLFSFWKPKDILVVFWIDVVVLTLVATSTFGLALFMLHARLKWRKGN